MFFYLTPQERKVLLGLAIVIAVGSVLNIAFKIYPRFLQPPKYTIAPVPKPPVDINQADFDALVAVPYIGPKTAGRILDYRNANGPFKTLDELLAVPGIYPKTYQKIIKHLRL